MAVRYGTPQFLLRSTVRYVNTVRYASILAKKYGTLVRYAFFVMVRVRYASKIEMKYGTLVRFKVQGTQFASFERTVLPSLVGIFSIRTAKHEHFLHLVCRMHEFLTQKYVKSR